MRIWNEKSEKAEEAQVPKVEIVETEKETTE